MKFRIFKDKDTDTSFLACWDVPEHRIEGLTKRVPRMMSYHGPIGVSHAKGSSEVFLYPQDVHDMKLLTDTLAMLGYEIVPQLSRLKRGKIPPSFEHDYCGDDLEMGGNSENSGNNEVYADPNH